MVDIHNYQRQLDRTINNIKNSKLINEDNRKTILGFYRFCLTDGLSAGKVLRYVDDAYRLARWVNKDLVTLTKTDIEEVIILLDKQSYSEWTKYCFKVALRKLFKWMRNSQDELPLEVKWIKMRQKNCNHKLPEDLLTEEEVRDMIVKANRPRERALIAALYESGCRIHELLNVRMKHVSFDNYGAVINVSGKTGSRRVRLVVSVPYIQDWINNHPFKNNPESFVWIAHDESMRIMGYDRVRLLLTRIAKRAGVKKNSSVNTLRLFTTN
jgi:site-specific recombinase XerD